MILMYTRFENAWSKQINQPRLLDHWTTMEPLPFIHRPRVHRNKYTSKKWKEPWRWTSNFSGVLERYFNFKFLEGSLKHWKGNPVRSNVTLCFFYE